MKRIAIGMMVLLAGLTGGLRAAEPAFAPSDTIRWSWQVEAGVEMTFTFTGKQGGTFVVDWGDRERDWFIGRGDEPITAHHTYNTAQLYNACLYGCSMWLQEDYVDTTVRGLNLEMVYVEGGTFMMGRDCDGFGYCAFPAHSVTLDGFHMGKFEITQAQWAAVMGTTLSDIINENGGSSYGLGDNYPMYDISWHDAVAFCEKLSEQTGNTYRLPTEAEWEYVARGGQYDDGTEYAGSDNLDEVAWYWDNSSSTTHPVGQKKPNGLGLYDMSGNVREWCSDWFNECYYNVSPSVNPLGPVNWDDSYVDPDHLYTGDLNIFRCSPMSEPGRVNRGGCYLDNDTEEHHFLLVYGRAWCEPDGFYRDIGFRVVCESYNPNAGVITALDASMVYVKGGTFQMGATAEQGDDAEGSEKPVHEVTLDGFYIAPTEVTQAQWKAVMGYSLEDIMAMDIMAENQYPPHGVGNDYPMYYITYDEANLFCKLLSARTGHTYRLPTEAEWEFAARGGRYADGTKYAGSNSVDRVAWYGEDFEAGGTHPVRQKLPNGSGLYDMSGNVYEWCSDVYDPEYYSVSPSDNPQGPESSGIPVCRGGCWESGGSICRVSSRSAYQERAPRTRVNGFRVVREIDYETDAVAALRESMVYVAGGTFQMGATAEQGDDPRDDEKPVHKVMVDGFYIGAYEVTQAQWKAVMGTEPSYFRDTIGHLPVESVTWEDAVAFCEKMSELTGHTYRLPTEAEWEYAARGGQNPDGTKYAGGNDINEVVWYNEDATHAVGQKQPNGLGLYDMSGNVYEWCLDWYSEDYYSKSSVYNPQGSETGDARVVRGGSFAVDAGWFCRVSIRCNYEPDIKSSDVGFRIVCEASKNRWGDDEVISALEASMVKVEGGKFRMGATLAQTASAVAKEDESPVHEVTLDSYFIGRYEVTQAQWKAVMGTEPASKDFGVDNDYPVYNISWDEAVAFCEKLNELTDHTYRLPTEAEWEYAARGGRFGLETLYAGGDNLDDVACYSVTDPEGNVCLCPKGWSRPNGLGLFDMSCNVAEWCSDWYSADYYGVSPSVNPKGPDSGTDHVCRGGGIMDDESACRVSARSGILGPNGFRVVRVLEPTDEVESVVADLEASMVKVEGGTFQMGATEEQGDDAKDNEKPVHEVTLDGFYIGAYEITQVQWEAVMGTNPSKSVGYDLPVESVSWSDAVAFCEKLSELTGHTYRLPTEAEWEYAARGGQNNDGTRYAGSDNSGVVWFLDCSDGRTHAVGQLEPNGLGLYDMSGNVNEWCSDWYGEDYYSVSPSVNPQGLESGVYRVARGGSYGNYMSSCRVAARNGLTPSDVFRDQGFRVVREFLTEKEEEEALAALEESMVYVEGGTFMMGATEEQGDEALDDEKPVHEVTVNEFYIGKFEVTQAQWTAVMGTEPSRNPGDNHPVEMVSWEEAVAFCEKLSERTGHTYRLPTEAEWEYAARGGQNPDGTKYAGSDNINEVMSGTYCEVGQSKPNGLGLYDMSGNVAEWCSDWRDADYYSVSPSDNPQGPASGNHRVIRGGSDSGDAKFRRVSSRFSSKPDQRGGWLGFRVVREP